MQNLQGWAYDSKKSFKKRCVSNVYQIWFAFIVFITAVGDFPDKRLFKELDGKDGENYAA